MTRRRLIEIEPPEDPFVIVRTGGPKKVWNKKRLRNPFAKKGKYRYEKLEIDWLEPIIAAVKQARFEQRLSQRQLVKLVGTGQAEISQFESGLSNPTVEFIDRITKKLGVDISELFKRLV